jgi:hypothetical protein
LLRFVRAKAIPPISCKRQQPEDHQPGLPAPADLVTGWLVKRGGLYSSGTSDPEYGLLPPHECPILVCSDGRCFALWARDRGLYEVTSEAIKRQGGPKGYRLNSPYHFLEAVQELAAPPK